MVRRGTQKRDNQSNKYITIYGENISDSQRIAPGNSPEIANIIVNHKNFRRYRRKAILYPIWEVGCRPHFKQSTPIFTQ